MLLVLAVLAAAFGSFQYDVARRLGWAAGSAAPAAIEPPAGVDLPASSPAPPVATSLTGSLADPAKVRAALSAYLKDKDLGPRMMAVVATSDGTVLFRHGTRATTPASTMKLLTGAAALEALGPETRLVTRVVQGATPREIVLVGGGDPYLSAKQLRTLAERTATALATTTGTTRVRLRFDDSLFTGPTVSPAWEDDYVATAVVSPITALAVDQGARIDGGYGFEKDPSAAAGTLFAAALRKAGVDVRGTPTRTTAVAGATELAVVRSAPMRQLVDTVLAVSDNEGAELLAHHVGIAEGFDGSFDGGSRGVTAVLERLGLSLAHDTLHDGSGLSRRDVLTARTLLDVLALGADDTRPELRTLLTGLPVAGFSGSLGARFTTGDVAGRGRVQAKTGTLSGVHGLAGVATDLDGNTLLFVLIADRVDSLDTLDARDTLDDLAAALGACHCS